eukprot:gene2001-2323_t
MPWPEVQDCIDKKKHEVRITGATLAKRLEESDSGSSSSCVPDEFCTELGPLLTFLELSGTPNLTSLPSSINVMHQLHELLVTNCGLTELPDGIGSLPLLRTLIGKVNKPVLCKPELHTLNVSKNKLTELPDALVGAGELHVLNVGFNQLQELPGCLVKLPKLSSLIASHNSITQLPMGISKLSLLTDLQMSHCSLTAVPQELADAPKLKVLVLDPNPFNDRKLTKLLPWDKQSRFEVFVHQEVKGVRPFLVCAVLLGVKFTPELYEKFITLQTSIHQSLCNKREAAAIGDKTMLRWEWLRLGHRIFVGLDIQTSSDLSAFPAAWLVMQPYSSALAVLAGPALTGLYLSYIQDKPSKASPLMAVLRDSTNAVLSLSPVINANFCRVTNTPDSQDILVEVSGNESLELVQKEHAAV